MTNIHSSAVDAIRALKQFMNKSERVKVSFSHHSNGSSTHSSITGFVEGTISDVSGDSISVKVDERSQFYISGLLNALVNLSDPSFTKFELEMAVPNAMEPTTAVIRVRVESI